MNERPPDVAARLLIRERPPGSPVMYQSWGRLLFLHWQVPAETIRPFIPPRLSIDTYDSRAWIAITPFTVWGLRPRFIPSLPWLSHFHEINVRTYVYLNGVPGVWFFSLDATRLLAAQGARAFFHLPYYHAKIQLEQRDNTIIYSSRRRADPKPAEFSATSTTGAELPPAEPGSLDFFLVERYCLYTFDKRRLYRSRIFHETWPLRQASLSKYKSSMFQANGLPMPDGEPLLHSAGPVHVAVWPLEQV